MYKTIDLNNESDISLNQIKNNNSTYAYDSFIDYSSDDNSLITKNHTDKRLKNDSISKIFLNNIKNYKLNSFLSTDINYSKTLSNSKIRKIKTFDRPIYNFLFSENIAPNRLRKYRKTEEILCHLTPPKRTENETISNNSKISQSQKNKFNRILILKKTKRDYINPLLNNPKKQYDYFPRLLDLKKSCMINKKNDKYKDRNILFTKLKELNFENELRNIKKKNFITSDIYLSLNNNNNSKFLEKKTSYKILENINFNFKSPNDKSKLQKYVKTFNLFSAINKFY